MFTLTPSIQHCCGTVAREHSSCRMTYLSIRSYNRYPTNWMGTRLQSPLQNQNHEYRIYPMPKPPSLSPGMLPNRNSRAWKGLEIPQTLTLECITTASSIKSFLLSHCFEGNNSKQPYLYTRLILGVRYEGGKKRDKSRNCFLDTNSKQLPTCFCSLLCRH